MITISLTASGISVLGVSIPSLGADLVHAVTDQAYLAMRVRAPVKTGELRDSITKRSVGLHGEVTVGAPHGVFVALGTRPHLIMPVRARALRFEAGGRIVFTKLVHHPGTRPNPFVQRAADIVQGLIPDIFQDIWQQKVK